MTSLPRLVQEIGYSVWSCFQGLRITMRNLLQFKKRKQVFLYPYEEIRLPPSYRGALHFEEDKCIVCELCEKACPVPGSRTEKTIELYWRIGDNKKRNLDEFYIDYSTCINCYLCVEACPTDALLPGSSWELAMIDPLSQYDRGRMILGKHQLEQLPESEVTGSQEHAYEIRPREEYPKPPAVADEGEPASIETETDSPAGVA